METKTYTRMELDQIIREIAKYEYKYLNKYTELEHGKKFTPTEEESKKYLEHMRILRENKILTEKDEFFYANGQDERTYYMNYNLEPGFQSGSILNGSEEKN